jgi:hypothetical protein
VDLPLGLHVLRFASRTDDRSSLVELQVGPESKVVRHAMGRTTSNSALRVTGIVLTSIAASLALTGTLLKSSSDDEKKDQAGTVVLGAGAMLAFPGLGLLIAGQPERQPGATTELVRRERP